MKDRTYFRGIARRFPAFQLSVRSLVLRQLAQQLTRNRDYTKKNHSRNYRRAKMETLTGWTPVPIDSAHFPRPASNASAGRGADAPSLFSQRADELEAAGTPT
jgi:hypothetical protein